MNRLKFNKGGYQPGMMPNIEVKNGVKDMSKKRESLQYHILQTALNGVTGHTADVYKHDIKAFAVFARENGCKTADQLSSMNKKDLIQSYTDKLVHEGKSPSTVHRYIAPVCKGLEVNMKEITKPKRTVDRISRSRAADQNLQGKIEQQEKRFARLVDFQSVTGLRRAELAKLTTSDLIYNQNGTVSVHVTSGKGGKEQYQRILPQNTELVIKTFETATGDRVFTRDEMKNKIDLHGLRGKNAQAAYKYYCEQMKAKPELRNSYAHELQSYFEKMNTRLYETKPREYNARLKAFKRDMYQSQGIYKIRGKSVDIAREKGLPIEYDRIALMMTSVFHLSHWRNDVTVINYMLK